jgi:hypothetical protein
MTQHLQVLGRVRELTLSAQNATHIYSICQWPQHKLARSSTISKENINRRAHAGTFRRAKVLTLILCIRVTLKHLASPISSSRKLSQAQPQPQER